MTGLQRQAALYFLGPLGFLIAIGLPYVLSGRLATVLTTGPGALDFLIFVMIIAAMLVPPIWGYRQMARLAGTLSQSSEVVRRVAEGDFSRTLSAWAAEHPEVSALEQGINATALRLQERVRELNAEKGRLEAILGNMAEGVILVDAQKRITLLNAAAEAMFGVAAAEALGRDYLTVTHHFDLDQKLERVRRTRQPETLEFKRARPEEQVLECRIAPAVVGEAGETGVLLVLRDITRFRRLEQMRTEFVSNVTHELRTPLTSIQGFAETLLEGALEEPEDARRFVTIIKRESEHLSRLIEDILDLSRIESGKMKMRKENLDLHALAEETLGRMQSKAQSLGVDLVIEVAQGLPQVQGDPTRLSQVLINLVDNALKYTPSGGRVTVSAVDSGPHLSVSVADTGCGIPKADLSRIFERFYRVDKARTRSTGGTGLGLSIVKHIVDAHGGSISVESDTGLGATFTFTLPKA